MADDRLSNERIAQIVGVTRKTIDNWKTEPAFAAQVQEIVQAARAAAMAHGIAVKEERIRGYQERQRLLWQVIHARAERGRVLTVLAETGLTPGGLPLPDGQTPKTPPPGIDTGLMVKQTKISSLGTVIEEWAVDTGLLSEMRAVEKQAAQELGQWTEKRELSGKDGGPVQIDLSGLSDEELALAAALRRKLAPPPGSD